MKEEIIKLSIDDIHQLRKAAGQSDKKIANAAMEFIRTPQSGVFGKVITKTFVIDNNEVTSVGLELVGGGFISETAITKQNLLPQLNRIKSGKRSNKYCLKSVRLTDLSNLGASQDSQLFNLQGKSFKTEQKEIRQYKNEYLDTVKFDAVCSSVDSDEALKSALEKTEIGTGYVFNIE